MTKRGLVTIIFALILLNVFTLIFSGGKKESQNDSPSNKFNEVNEDNSNFSGKNVSSSEDAVANFGEESITYGEWMKSLRDTHGKEHLETMILKHLVKRFAEEKNLEVNPKVLEREVSFLTTMSGVMSDDQLEEQKKEWEEELTFRHQLESFLTEDVQVSDEEAQFHYASYKNQYNFTASYQLSHIVVDDMRTAEKIISELEEGAQFSLLAQEYSTDEDTRDVGGYLGYFTKESQFVPYGYPEVVDGLDEQSYSDPINLGDRVAIVYLHRDLPEVKSSFEESKGEILRELAMKQVDQNQRIEELWTQLGIEWIFDK